MKDPLLWQKQKSENISQDEILDFFKDKVVKWQIPDKVIFVDELPYLLLENLLKKALKRRIFPNVNKRSIMQWQSILILSL